ncbi:hypothetical protein D3C81_2260330 [compost metagenome]
MRERGGVLVHILRPDAPPVRAHGTEAGLAIGDNDLVINNDGDLAEFIAKIEAALHIAIRRTARHAA